MILKTVYGSTLGSVGWTLLGFLIVAGLIAALIKVLSDEIGTRKQISILKPTPEDFQQFITALSVLVTNSRFSM